MTTNNGALCTFKGLKKRFVPLSKFSPQNVHTPFGALSRKNMAGDNDCVVLELVPLKDENNFKPCQQKRSWYIDLLGVLFKIS